MQYQVPQFIESEDKIIGPLTLKQFLYLAFAAVILFVLNFLLTFYVWILIAIPISALAAAFAFLKINDRPFVYFFISLVRYFTKPKLYIFSSEEKEKTISSPAKLLVPPNKISEGEEKKLTSLKLKELAMNLDADVNRLDGNDIIQ